MFSNMNYGIGAQALAVQAYLASYSGIEASWSEELKMYMADVGIAPWYNGRECGIVVYLRIGVKQLNIAIFEHRNSDNIAVVMFEAFTLNPPTLQNVPEGVYTDKYDTTKQFPYGRAAECAEWVYEQLESYWVKVTTDDD